MRSLLVTLLLAALAVALGLALRPAAPEKPAEARERPRPNTADILPTQPAVRNEASSPLSATPEAATNELAQTINGVEISVFNARKEGEFFVIDVCHERPDNNNWLMKGVSVQYGGQTFSGVSASAIEIRDAPVGDQQRVIAFEIENGKTVERWEPALGGTKGRRCDRVKLEVGSLVASEYEFTISALRMLPDESAWCDAYLENVQAALDARDLGIRLDCNVEDWGSNTSITSKPDTMSQEEAEEIVADVAWELFHVYGPWVFRGRID